ncbi:hypothetical protein HHK36_005553 [Tetracentron sinense]|uniref:Gnk2-homologous domain-containing protein n=1 Tax=Tetracentron sinense TaxID=13715 RepID=A0A834ZVL5_TETSI|nr:hypothetical protein HHK36_005553 [Tetracentron sinense]
MTIIRPFLRATVLLLMVYFLTLGLGSDAQPTYLYHNCPNTTYTPNSTYQSNLRILLSSLSSNATVGNGFYNLTTGRDPNIVYGLYMCRGDVTNDTCGNCVETASKEILDRCPEEKVATTWYDECMLRFSNQSIFSILQESPGLSMWNTQNVSDPSGTFNQLVADTMNSLATRAASGQSRMKFATGEANFTGFQTLYSLVQCTPDLSASDCNRCLRGAIDALPSCCSGKRGGRVIRTSCNLRYEIYRFYGVEATSPAPSPIPLPPTPVFFHIPTIPVNALHLCFGSQNYTSGGQFETNLKHLFNSLYTKGPPSRFNTTISGETPDRVYGLVQCDPTSSEEDCRSYVNASSIEIVQKCPNRKQAVLRNDNCYLRYSDSSFFSQVDASPRLYAWPLKNVSDPLVFSQQLGALMDNLSTTAASSQIKYATGITNFTVFEKIYGLLQCTRDLSVRDCYLCLREIIGNIPTCCNGRAGGNVLSVSCNLRYEIYPFFEILSPPPPSPLEASPPPPQIEGDQNTNKTENGKFVLWANSDKDFISINGS